MANERGDFTSDNTFDEVMGPGSKFAADQKRIHELMLARKWFQDPDTGRWVQEYDPVHGLPGRMPGEGIGALVRRKAAEIAATPQHEPENPSLGTRLTPWFDPAIRENIVSPSTGQNLADSIHWIIARLRGEPL